MSLRLIAVVSVLALTVAGAGSAATRTSIVKVTAKDYSFVLSPKTVPHGRVTFVLKNMGHADHDFAIAGKHSKTIGPGKTTKLTVTLKRGRYPYSCTVDSHAKLGMRGMLRVT
jgi:uncharacterized cupredoxin-like copper-binding protein